MTATSAISLIATFLMGLFANLPLGLAPGLGGMSCDRLFQSMIRSVADP